MDSVLIQQFADDEIINSIVALALRNKEFGKQLMQMETPQDEVIEKNWATIDARLDALESIVGSAAFHKRNFQHVLVSIISYLSTFCEYSVKKNTKSFIVRICEMFARDARPSEYDFSKFVF